MSVFSLFLQPQNICGIFLYVKDILHIVYVKYKERKKENVK